MSSHTFKFCLSLFTMKKCVYRMCLNILSIKVNRFPDHIFVNGINIIMVHSCLQMHTKRESMDSSIVSLCVNSFLWILSPPFPGEICALWEERGFREFTHFAILSFNSLSSLILNPFKPSSAFRAWFSVSKYINAILFPAICSTL